MTNRPHDALFKAVFGQAEHARGLFLGILPESLCTAFAWETLALEAGSFVDEELADCHSDLLFSTRLDGAPAYIYLLLEHQSTVDGAMPLRMYNYLGRIWKRCSEDNIGPLPPVIPIVVSHAVGGWTAPVAFEAMFEPQPASIPGLAQYVPQFSLVLVDLADLSNEELRDRALGAFPQLALWLLRDARDATKLFENLVFWVATFRQALASPRGMEVVSLLLRYIAWVCDDLHFREFREKIREQLPEGERAAMTMAEQLIQQGREEGREEGREQGVRDTLTKLLLLKFNAIPTAYEAQIQAATTAQLERYAARILTATTIESVFAED